MDGNIDKIIADLQNAAQESAITPETP